MRVTCENCGFGLATTHQGAWDHVCPDGRHGHVVCDGHVDFTAVTVALSSFGTTAAQATDALTHMWATYNTYHQKNRT